MIFEDPLEKLALIADSVLDIYNIPQENIKNSSGLDKLSRFIDFEVEMNNRTVKIINTKNYKIKILNIGGVQMAGKTIALILAGGAGTRLIYFQNTELNLQHHLVENTELSILL